MAKLKQVQTALTRFILAHERLRNFQADGHLRLCEAGNFSAFTEDSSECNSVILSNSHVGAAPRLAGVAQHREYHPIDIIPIRDILGNNHQESP